MLQEIQQYQREWRVNLGFTGQSPIVVVAPPIETAQTVVCAVPGLSAYPCGFLTVKPEDSEWIGPERQIVKILTEQFKTVSAVSSIHVRFEEGIISVWTLLKSYDRDAREQLYARELDICRGLNFYDFYFRVTSKDLVSPDELTRAGDIEIFRNK